ncbi:MAG: sigma-54 interaction domain-containing protein [Nitrospinaceae bacterium]
MKVDFEHVLNNAHDGVFIVNREHSLVLFNLACKELYGVSREAVVDKASWRLHGFKQALNQAAAEGLNISYGELGTEKERMVLSHKEGKRIWVEISYTPIFDGAMEEIAYIMGVIKDITELKRVEEEKERLYQELAGFRRELERKYDFSRIVGGSSRILEVLKLAGQVAGENTTVMLVGESGTGKELVARAIHYNSPRKAKPFVALNCSALPETLIESELFGYEKGAFTGAQKSKPGKVQLAAGGTLFLDEIAEMSSPAQVKILRLIQEREFEPLGAVHPQQVDIRIIAATNQDLQAMVREGRFREDLYYRLFVYPIFLPPLRERPEDIPLIAGRLLRRFNRDMGKRMEGIAPAALEILLKHPWPGNVRELQNVMERLMILAPGPMIQVPDLPHYLRHPSRETVELDGPMDATASGSLNQRLRDIEQRLILDAWEQCGRNKTRAARMLGLTRSTFRYKLARVARFTTAVHRVDIPGVSKAGKGV